MRASGIQQLMNQAGRDSQVLGNGYFVTNLQGEGEAYCLRPEDVVVENGQFFRQDAGHLLPVRGHVLHLKGVEASVLPYGLSVLEPFVMDLVTHRIYASAADSGHQLAEANGIPESEKAIFEQMIEMAAREDQLLAASLEKRISPVVDLYGLKTGLYFPGQETMS